jgi:hercynine metabolism protein
VSWLEELESRLEQQLEAFLASNPAQDALLREQEARDRQARLIGRRRQLQLEAERRRNRLLELAGEIRQWRERVARARRAGADELAERAEAHGASLMDQGRRQWQQLEGLGREFAELERQLSELGDLAGRQRAAAASPSDSQADLERAWAAFETEQELEQLRRRQG